MEVNWMQIISALPEAAAFLVAGAIVVSVVLSALTRFTAAVSAVDERNQKIFDEYQDICAQHKAALERCRDEMATQKDRYEALLAEKERAIAAITTQRDEIARQLAQNEVERQQIQERVAALESKEASMTEEIAAMSAEVAAIRRENEQLQAKCKRLEKQYRDLIAEKERLEKERAEAVAEAEALRVELAKAREEKTHEKKPVSATD